jgi:hypothetical protein
MHQIARLFYPDVTKEDPDLGDSSLLAFKAEGSIITPRGAVSKKKYKPIAQKIKPVVAAPPSEFHIECNIIGDPLATLPILNPQPPVFVPTGHYTQEHMEAMEKWHSDFLWDEKIKLIHHFMCLQNEGFTWNDLERGKFNPDYFLPVKIPVISHTPWIEHNIPIPPGIYDEVCDIIHKKIELGVYKASNSAYWSRWFCTLKKDGKSLHLVHSLEPLNKVTIKHSGVPPIPEHLTEQFAGWSCGGVLDLYVGYNERLIKESSCDYTTFQTPFGTLQLITLPMGWTNSVPIFHDDVTYILQPEIPDFTIPYIDDIPIKGPPTWYIQSNSSPETIAENQGICHLTTLSDFTPTYME